MQHNRYARGGRVCRRSVVVATLLAATSVALGHWATPTQVPVARVIANAQEYTEEHPQDAQGYYILARVHGLAFITKARVVYIFDRNDAGRPPRVASDFNQRRLERWVRENPDEVMQLDELESHLEASIINYQEAVRLDPTVARYHLGLAYVLDASMRLGPDIDVVPQFNSPSGAPADDATPPRASQPSIADLIKRLESDLEGRRALAIERLRQRLAEAAPILHEHRNHLDPVIREYVRDLLVEYWRECAIQAYLNAFDRASGKDIQIETKPLRGLRTLVSFEAGEAYLRLVNARRVRDDGERDHVDRVRTHLAKLKATPERRAITPVIFDLTESRPLADLLRPDLTVEFDLDGDGVSERWPWVAPSTAILVWDPDGKGIISSGRQLFGSVTWWMFFTDGYQAMSMLDDDRDGELTGEELRGLAVWFDCNSNGVSDSGEVMDVRKIGIAGLSTLAVSLDGQAPMNPRGLRLTNGTTLPTYDWVTCPVSEGQ